MNTMVLHTIISMCAEWLILKTTQSPGDVVMLTAAVREWKRALGVGVEILSASHGGGARVVWRA